MRFVALALALLGCSGCPCDPAAEFCAQGFSPRQGELIAQSLAEWRAVSRGGVEFTLGCSPESVPITAVPGLIGAKGKWSPGVTDTDGIELDPTEDATGEQGFRITVLHELGHWLIGWRHSEVEEAVMYDHYTGQAALTGVDAAMLWFE